MLFEEGMMTRGVYGEIIEAALLHRGTKGEIQIA